MLSTRAQAAALKEVLPMTSCNDRLLGSLSRATTSQGHQLHWEQAAWKGTFKENFSHPSTIPSLPLPAFMTAGQCRWGQTDDKDLMGKRKGGRNGSAKGKRILLRRQKENNGGHKTPPSSPAVPAGPGRSCSELSPSSARPSLIFLVIGRLVFQKKPGSVFFSANGFCIAWA